MRRGQLGNYYHHHCHHHHLHLLVLNLVWDKTLLPIFLTHLSHVRVYFLLSISPLQFFVNLACLSSIHCHSITGRCHYTCIHYIVESWDMSSLTYEWFEMSCHLIDFLLWLVSKNLSYELPPDTLPLHAVANTQYIFCLWCIQFTCFFHLLFLHLSFCECFKFFVQFFSKILFVWPWVPIQ